MNRAPTERPPGRARLSAAILGACLSGIACIATLVEPRWFELLFDESPDGGDGSLESIVAVLVSLAACVLFAGLARRESRRLRSAAAAVAQAHARP
jgi:hypothetical protein